MPAHSTEEQFTLFRAYQRMRHADGEMAHMDFYDYQTLVEDTPVDTVVFEFRDADARLVAACIVDRVADGLSAVYSFFDPTSTRRCLGSYMILWLTQHVKLQGGSYVYLGYWIAECSKMSYKARFQPLEAYTPVGWRPLRLEESEPAFSSKAVQ